MRVHVSNHMKAMHLKYSNLVNKAIYSPICNQKIIL